MTIPPDYMDLLTDTLAFAHLATLMDDGSPQVTPVWFLYDGQHIVVNSAKDRVKDKNMKARPQVAVEIMAPDNPYRYLSIRGRVVEITEEGAYENVLDLSEKYRNRREFTLAEGEIRVMYKIAIDHVYPRA